MTALFLCNGGGGQSGRPHAPCPIINQRKAFGALGGFSGTLGCWTTGLTAGQEEKSLTTNAVEAPLMWRRPLRVSQARRGLSVAPGGYHDLHPNYTPSAVSPAQPSPILPSIRFAKRWNG